MTSIQIRKGEPFSLDKSEGIERVMINLSWNSDADVDISAFLVGENGLIRNDADFVFYNSMKRVKPIDRECEPYDPVVYGSRRNWMNKTIPISTDGSVILSKDDDLGYDEEVDLRSSKEKECCVYCDMMHVDLFKVSPHVKEIIFCATIYHGDDISKTFGEVSNLSIILFNEKTKEELCCYKVEENFSTETAIEAAKLVRKENNAWDFEAVGEGHDGGLQTLVDIYA